MDLMTPRDPANITHFAAQMGMVANMSPKQRKDWNARSRAVTVRFPAHVCHTITCNCLVDKFKSKR